MNGETANSEAIDRLINIFSNSNIFNRIEQTQMMKTVDAIMNIQRRFNITMMPIYLILKFMMIITLILKEDASKDLLKILKLPDEKETRKLFKKIVRNKQLEEGDIMLFYKSGEDMKLYGDFLHLISLFDDSVKTIGYPLNKRCGISEVSSISGINFNSRIDDLDQLNEIDTIFVASLEKKIVFDKPFKNLGVGVSSGSSSGSSFGSSSDSDKIYWQGNKDDIRSYVLRDTYHWIELNTKSDSYSFVFIIDTSSSSISLTMHNIVMNCQNNLTEFDECRFIIEKDKLSDFEKNYILYFSDLDLSIDKFIDHKIIKPWKNSINYKIDIEFDGFIDGDEFCDEKEEDRSEDIKIIDGCDKNIRFIILDKVHKIPLLFGSL